MAASDVVHQYLAASGRRDFEAARQLLADDLDFKGPIDTFHRADDYLLAIRRLAAIVQEVRVQKEFVDGDDVCLIYDLVTNTPAGTAPVAEWFRVRAGKIAQIRVFFDARPFAPPAGH